MPFKMERILAMSSLFCVIASAPGFSQQTATRFADVLLTRPTVTGAPFSATRTDTSKLTQTGRETTRSYKLYRDSAGRTSAVPADTPSGYNPRFNEIDDPIAGYWYILDVNTHTAYQFKMPPKIARQPSAAPKPEVSSLGTMQLLGVQAEGTRTFMPNGNMIERWDSPQLHLTMVLRTVTETGTGVTQITELTPADPPSSVFAVPSDYTVVQQTSPFVIR